MSEWAILKNGEIVDVVTTGLSRSEMQRKYPNYQIEDIYGLPSDVQQRYQYWDERP